MTTNRAVLTVTAAFAVLAAGPAAAQAKTETDSQGTVKATFSYTANKDRTQFKNLKVQILRANVPVLTSTLPRYKEYWPGGRVNSSSVDVRDLDGDGEPEVQIKLYSGGVNCCLGSLIYRYRPATNDYTSVFRDFGSYGFSIKELNRKAPPELVTADIRFSGAFGTVSANQRAPVQILQYVKGKFVDVTRSHPVSLRKDLRELRKDYPLYAKQKANRRGILASIAADQLLLNDRDGVVRTFQRIEVLYGNEFSDRLKNFLARRGYKLKSEPWHAPRPGRTRARRASPRARGYRVAGRAVRVVRAPRLPFSLTVTVAVPRRAARRTVPVPLPRMENRLLAVRPLTFTDSLP